MDQIIFFNFNQLFSESSNNPAKQKKRIIIPEQLRPTGNTNYMENGYATLAALSKTIEKNAWASYFVGKYYFLINTRKFRHQFELDPGSPVTIAVQKNMQAQNAIALFHEYFHYIHEISTVTGNINLALDIALKSIFSNYFDTNIESSEHYGVDTKDKARFEIYSKIHATKEVLNGSIVQNGKILQVQAINLTSQKIYLLTGADLIEYEIDIPAIRCAIYEDGQHQEIDLIFGKFFLYEGLAYELDRELERQLLGKFSIHDIHKYSEYTVLRLIAKNIWPDIDTRLFLTLASLSLGYLNCAATFITLVRRAYDEVKGGKTKDSVLETFKLETGALLHTNLDNFNEAQGEIMEVFKKRTQLYKAFAAICRESMNGYAVRANNPAFEVDLIFSGKYSSLLDVIPLCDYMYTFLDADEFNRDFMGTTTFSDEISQACKTLIAYDHYQKSHGLSPTLQVEKKQSTKCPFFTCCNLALRQEHEHICAERPWRIFEISTQSDRQYCWYGTGVAEFKGHTEL